MTTTGLLRNLSLVFSFSALIACGSDGGSSPAPLNETASSPPQTALAPSLKLPRALATSKHSLLP